MLIFPCFSVNQDANIKPRIQFRSLLFFIFLCLLGNQPEGYKGYSFVYLIFLQTVRCESERRAMTVGTNTAVTAEFRVGFRVPHAVVDSHFFFCECTLKSHCYCFLLGDWDFSFSFFCGECVFVCFFFFLAVVWVWVRSNGRIWILNASHFKFWVPRWQNGGSGCNG